MASGPQMWSATRSMSGKGREASCMAKKTQCFLAPVKLAPCRAAFGSPYKASSGEPHGTDRQSVPRRHGQNLHRCRGRREKRARRDRHIRQTKAGTAPPRHGLPGARGGWRGGGGGARGAAAKKGGGGGGDGGAGAKIAPADLIDVVARSRGP